MNILKHNNRGMYGILFVMLLLAVIFGVGYRDHEIAGLNRMEQDFFGDSTLRIVSSNTPNGYNIEFLKSPQLILMKLSRGDTIRQYVAIEAIPESVGINQELESKSINCRDYLTEMNIPVMNELGEGMFFMDVNFDGEQELVIEYPGYNRKYYACYDLINGDRNICPGLLQAMSEPPFNNIVGGENGETEFDYINKKMHQYETIGCCSSIETWCEMVSDYEGDVPKLRIIEQSHINFSLDGINITDTYRRINGELLKVATHREYPQ